MKNLEQSSLGTATPDSLDSSVQALVTDLQELKRKKVRAKTDFTNVRKNALASIALQTIDAIAAKSWQTDLQDALADVMEILDNLVTLYRSTGEEREVAKTTGEIEEVGEQYGKAQAALSDELLLLIGSQRETPRWGARISQWSSVGRLPDVGRLLKAAADRIDGEKSSAGDVDQGEVTAVNSQGASPMLDSSKHAHADSRLSLHASPAGSRSSIVTQSSALTPVSAVASTTSSGTLSTSSGSASLAASASSSAQHASSTTSSANSVASSGSLSVPSASLVSIGALPVSSASPTLVASANSGFQYASSASATIMASGSLSAASGSAGFFASGVQSASSASAGNVLFTPVVAASSVHTPQSIPAPMPLSMPVSRVMNAFKPQSLSLPRVSQMSNAQPYVPSSVSQFTQQTARASTYLQSLVQHPNMTASNYVPSSVSSTYPQVTPSHALSATATPWQPK